MKTITLSYRMGTASVEAHVIGKFAVHTPNGDPLKGWPSNAYYRISHVASGCALGNVQGLKAAKDVARQLDALLDTDIGPADYEEGNWSERYKAFVETGSRLFITQRKAGGQ